MIKKFSFSKRIKITKAIVNFINESTKINNGTNSSNELKEDLRSVFGIKISSVTVLKINALYISAQIK